MIIGTGCDLVEIKRIRRAMEKESFLKRVYTEEERRQSGGRPSFLAGSFAVKEAVAKVFGTGFREFFPGDVEVLRDGLGKPYVNLYGGAKRTAERLHVKRLHVSISNTDEYAMAFAVGEGEAE